MYQIAILIGVYSYLIFFLGIFGILTKTGVLIAATVCLFASFYVFKNLNFANEVEKLFKKIKSLSKLSKIILFLLLLQISINFIGVLGPELSFDALWYHLTLPKIYVQEHSIMHIPGGVFYYSDMPKLLEMVYVPLIMFGNEILAKFTHLVFGLACLILIYKVSRKFVSIDFSILACTIFYTNLVVGWLSITAYVDLARTFFELVALNYLLEKSYARSAVGLGLAVSTKILAFSSVLIFLPLLYLKTKSTMSIIRYTFIVFCIPLPWLIFSYINTGNPFYPFFSNIYPISSGFNLSNFINFIHSPDPISPIYLIVLPFMFLYFNKMKENEKFIVYYSALGFIVWFFLPQTGGGRFIVPLLPALSILSVIMLSKVRFKFVKSYLILLILFITILNITYRAVANAKYIPVISGYESKRNFLINNLIFSFGDFYDTDGFFEKNIKPSDRVLIYGIHNLYYVNFPFIHESYLTENDKFNYILVRDSKLPVSYNSWKLVYQNNLTKVKLYKEPKP